MVAVGSEEFGSVYLSRMSYVKPLNDVSVVLKSIDGVPA